jgi:uncharacterized protein (DUF488 family)
MSKHPSPQETEWPEGAVFAVGHSTLPIERFVALLHAFGIESLADIRTVPRSRHNPQFNGDALGRALKPQNIDYVPLPALGGLRHARKDSSNTGWRNTNFRGYADYMQTEAFAEGLATLIHMSRETYCHHVRGSGAVALPPLAGGRCAQCARHPGGRDFIGEQLPHA